MSLHQDLSFSFRTLRKSPGFTLAAVLCFALGIGATTAMFSVVNAVLLRPLPFHEADRVVGLWNHLTKMDLDWLGASAPEYLEYVERNAVFEQIAAYHMGFEVTIGGEAGPESIIAGLSTPSLFPLLGVKAEAGRTFVPEEGVRGEDDVVLLSHGLWRRRFGGDRSVVGRKIEISGEPLTVVGVLPSAFHLEGEEVDIWAPLAFDLANLRPRRQRYLNVLGRLKDGLSPAQAQAGIEKLVREVEQEYPEVYQPQGRQVVLVPLQERMVAEVRPALIALLGAVALVLLISCVNVANLLLARATRRQGEIALRTALGADRLRLLRQVLAESTVLAVLGGAVGLLGASWALGLLVAIHPESIPRVDEIQLDGTVVTFTVALSLLTGLAFGLIPGVQLFRREFHPLLKEGGRSTGGRGRLRNALVVSEVALAFVLLIGAGLLIESFRQAQRVDPGLEANELLTLRVTLPYSQYREDSRAEGFYRSLLERIEGLPGVEEAAMISNLPLSGQESLTGFLIEGRSLGPADGAPSADERVVSPGYHQAMGIGLVQGRYFQEGDTAQSARVALIDETLARRDWPGESPIGRRIQLGSGGDGPLLTIVGVVEHVRQHGLDRESRPQIYVPFSQGVLRSMSLLVRTSGDPLTLASSVRDAVWELDPGQPVSEIRSMEQVIDDSFAPRRFSTALLASFSAIALLLASLGIYGVMAYNVAQRGREIGLRVAMGAQRSDVLRLIVGQGMFLTLIGLLAGGLGAVALTRFLASQLFGVGAHDPAVFTVVALSLAAIALLASFVPARRALRFDPISILKSE
ncbi:MAG TPA: ABC transporter permease [Thermoanaerobaculia bacterium]|nr:ABC transporter permease [Thermoanaerobaculia bacterium]